MIVSRPAKAETSISSVLWGRWKLVSSMSVARKGVPGRMKMLVMPPPGRTWPCSSAAVSSVRTLVVPTHTTRPPAALARLMRPAASSLTS